MHPIRELRLFAGLTQADFALRLACQVPHLSNVETGKARCGEDLALRISEAFRVEMLRAGITTEDLLRGNRARPDAAAARRGA